MEFKKKITFAKNKVSDNTAEETPLPQESRTKAVKLFTERRARQINKKKKKRCRHE